jgi:hypothetical protein
MDACGQALRYYTNTGCLAGINAIDTSTQWWYGIIRVGSHTKLWDETSG